MKNYFELANKLVIRTEKNEGPICVISAPSAHEAREIMGSLQIDQHDFDSALDPDEISRLEIEPELTTMIWKVPKQVTVEEELHFDVASVGIFMQYASMTMLSADDSVSFPPKEFQGVASARDVLLKYLFVTTRHYLGHLKVIKQITAELESKISSSMENRYLLQMFALGESLTYYMTAIEGNRGVLLKLASKAKSLGFTEQQIDFLDDIIVENKQSSRQAQIYSSVLSGLMDARGSIINNNMNILLKNLTMINIVFLPLNLIASIGGMSEFSMMTQGVSWKVSYFLFSVAMLAIGWLTWFALSRTETQIHKKMTSGGR